MLHVGHVNWYIPLFLYLLLVCSCLVVRSFSMVLSVPKVTLTLVLLKIFVMALVSLPTYVNLTHLVSSFLRLCPFLVLNFRRIDVSCLLLFRICSIVLCSFSMFSCANWYETILLCKHLIAATLCSLGWHQLLGMITSVDVGFL